tara:strand:+ start:1083 stop:1433 length:351 start_codon:yes stop_codon:yes gene_type:complete
MKIVKQIADFFKRLFTPQKNSLEIKKQIEDMMVHSLSLETRVRSLSILVNKQSQLLSDIAKIQSDLALTVYGSPSIESMLGPDLEIFEIESEDFKLDSSIPLVLISSTDDDDDLIN